MWTILGITAGVSVALVVVVWAAAGAIGYVGRALVRPEPVRIEPGNALEPRVAALEVKVAALPSLWEEERSRAQKWMDRARKSEQRAEEIMEAVEAGPEPDGFLRAEHGAGGSEEEMQPLPGDVEGGGNGAVPDHITLARARGFDPLTLATMGP